ncbi:MAG: hypothetical protein ACLTF6_01385 [Clostridium sp.]
MRLYKLIGLEILALQKEYKECLKRIAEYEKILKSRDGMNKVIREDLDHIKEEFAVPRKTLIENGKEAVYDGVCSSSRRGCICGWTALVTASFGPHCP